MTCFTCITIGIYCVGESASINAEGVRFICFVRLYLLFKISKVAMLMISSKHDCVYLTKFYVGCFFTQDRFVHIFLIYQFRLQTKLSLGALFEAAGIKKSSLLLFTVFPSKQSQFKWILSNSFHFSFFCWHFFEKCWIIVWNIAYCFLQNDFKAKCNFLLLSILAVKLFHWARLMSKSPTAPKTCNISFFPLLHRLSSPKNDNGSEKNLFSIFLVNTVCYEEPLTSWRIDRSYTPKIFWDSMLLISFELKKWSSFLLTFF